VALAGQIDEGDAAVALGVFFEGGFQVVGGGGMPKRLIIGLLALVTGSCGLSNAATTAAGGANITTASGTSVPLLAPGEGPANLGDGETAEAEDIVVDLSYTGSADLSAFADEHGTVLLWNLPWFESGDPAPEFATPGGQRLVAAFAGTDMRVLVAETIVRSDGLPDDRAAFVTPDGMIVRVTSTPLDGQPAGIPDGLAVERLSDGSDVAVKEHDQRVWVLLIKQDRQVIVIAFPGPNAPENARFEAADVISLAQMVVDSH
jgi:hypothetical protein